MIMKWNESMLTMSKKGARLQNSSQADLEVGHFGFTLEYRDSLLRGHGLLAHCRPAPHNILDTRMAASPFS